MDKKTIYLFHGHDNYSAQQKLNHWRAEFEKKYGDLNIQVFEGENFTASQFSEAIATVPFLTDKKLLIIRDFLRDGKEDEQKEVAEKLEEAAEYNIIVFIEHEKPDARTALFKRLGKTGQTVEFEDLDDLKLNKWIEDEFTRKSAKIGKREVQFLAETVGPNLWQMSQEVEKLALYSQNQPLDIAAIENLASANVSASIFKLTDYLAQKNSRESLKTLNTLIQSGEDLFQIFFMIVRHFRILIQIKACLGKKLDKQQIIQKTKEHPYAVTQGMNQCKNFSEEKMAAIYKKLLQIDIDTKSSRIKVTTGDNTEMRLALEKLIVDLCLA